MTARDMFEALNLEQIRNDDNYIEYVRNGLGGYISILFSLRWKSIKSTYGYQARGTNHHEIPLDELKAIIQQCKELGWLEDEKQEIKQETNLERYFDDIGIFGINSFAVTSGKPMRCKDVHCDKCDFGGPCGRCGEERLIWLTSPYKKPTYKLSQFEYDLLNAFDHCKECCLLNEIECLKRLNQKGYFKGIDPFTKVHEILENCEIKDVKG